MSTASVIPEDLRHDGGSELPEHPTTAAQAIPTSMVTPRDSEHLSGTAAAPFGSERTSRVGFVPGYCDPWWYVCVPGGFVPVDNIVGERSSTDFGMDFGGGVNFGVIYAEVRYHYIWGPTIEGTDQKANGKFLATTFGFRF